MTDSIFRFSSRVDDYIKYRPGYPQEVIKLLASECGLTADSVVADVGSGTGILSELFLRYVKKVYGIEPNREMRIAAERLLKDYANFQSIDGKAEATTLAKSNVDFVTAAQAFHWFDQPKARQEFASILKPDGWAVLIWNERRLDSTPFLRAYEELLLEFGTDYEQVRHENVERDIASFFAPEAVKLAAFENLQEFGFIGLQGRLLSSSYTPAPEDRRYQPMLAKLREIFSTHQKNDQVIVEYVTKVYYGLLRPIAIESSSG
ncbi:MAG TPA: class I SAM-dependent methyltransferase [Pyrinomonadaceae bacterium]|nr:class I SAM-dependent methyltransferase [Pyrinomonadaceae bacterium]